MGPRGWRGPEGGAAGTLTRDGLPRPSPRDVGRAARERRGHPMITDRIDSDPMSNPVIGNRTGSPAPLAPAT